MCLAVSQAAAAKAPQLSKEEMKKLRQERDPHFRGGKALYVRVVTCDAV